MKILITGASGFIGSFLVEEALKRGYETWAGIRKTSSRRYLQDERIHFIELDFNSEETLTEQLRPHEFDYIIHAAGVTKSARKSRFKKVNYDGTRNLVYSLIKLKMPVKKFVFLSSLSVFGPVREAWPHIDIRTTDHPKPNTEYGKSKLETERFLHRHTKELNYTILRPTGVYGPRDKDYLMMIKSIKRHLDIASGFKKQILTFVYVQDVVDACFLALANEKSGHSYFITDGDIYETRDFSNLVRQELNTWCLRLKCPLWILRIITFFGDIWGKITGHVTALNNDKYHILAQRNWACDVGKAIMDLGYKPKVKLEDGVKMTIQWYKDNKWL